MSSLNLTPTPAPNLTLFDFAVPKLAGRWRNIDDPVMGGVSRSRVGVSQGQLRFDGVVSLDNNGGFASVRSDRFASPVDASGFAAIRIRARGDGKTYILSLESASDPRLSYWQRFDTRAGEWTEAVLPLNGFEPQFRGFRPRGAVLLDPARLLSVSIYIADKQSGPFALDVAWMRAEGRAAPVPR